MTYLPVFLLHTDDARVGLDCDLGDFAGTAPCSVVILSCVPRVGDVHMGKPGTHFCENVIYTLPNSQRNRSWEIKFSSIQFSRLIVSDSLQPMDCSMQGLHVHHQLLELAQTQVHRVSDAIQPSHPLSSPSPPTFNLSQHQGFFQ